MLHQKPSVAWQISSRPRLRKWIAFATYLGGLNDAQVDRIITSLNSIRSNPFPRTDKIEKIKRKKGNYYRPRIGKIRVFYFIENTEIAVLRILSKKDAEKYISRLE